MAWLAEQRRLVNIAGAVPAFDLNPIGRLAQLDPSLGTGFFETAGWLPARMEEYFASR